eukprot:2064821-Amphidinium_carterae.1
MPLCHEFGACDTVMKRSKKEISIIYYPSNQSNTQQSICSIMQVFLPAATFANRSECGEINE